MGEQQQAPETGAATQDQAAGQPETGTPAATVAGAGQPETGSSFEKIPDDHPVAKALKTANAEAAAARSKLKELEDAEKSELQRATENLSEVTAERDELRTELVQLKVAVEHGLTGSDVDLLGSGTAEELEARAKRIVELQGDSSQPRRPKPVPGQGSVTQPAISAEQRFGEIFDQL